MSAGADPIAEYLRHLREERRLSPRTVAAYGRDLKKFRCYLDEFRPADFTRLSPEGVRGLIAAEHRRGLSGRSIQRLLAAIRGFYR